jgi:RHS repeat-associated protein
MPVDIGSGAVFTIAADFRIPGSVAINWRRHYSTVAASDTWLGPKWTVPYFMRLVRHADRYVLSGAHGEEVTFFSPSGTLPVGIVLPNLAANMELRRSPDQYRVVHWHTGGSVSVFCFNPRPDGTLPLAAIENLSGHRIVVAYDKAGRPVRLVQELEQNAIEMTYDQKNLISAISFVGDSGRKLLVRYEYDSKRRLVAALDALGHRQSYEYDANTRLVAEMHPMGSRFLFEYDKAGRCIHTKGEDGFDEKRLEYHAVPPLTRVTNSYGTVTLYYLNAAGQVVQIVNPVGGVTTNTFDEHGRLVGVTRPNGAKESFAYDDQGNRIAATNPNGDTTRTEHDDQHRPTKVTDPTGEVVDFTNWKVGSLLGVEDLPPGVWKYHWNGRGFVDVAENGRGRRVQIRREPRLRWLEWQDEVSLVKRTEFDEMGYPTELRDAEGLESRTRYDELHRPVEVVRGSGEVVLYRWNAGGRIAERIGPGDDRLNWVYNQYGYTSAQVNALGATVSFEYDTEGARTAITNRVGDRVEYRRDAYGRVVEEKLFDGRVQRYELDPDGRQEKIYLPDGRTVSQKFDPAGNLILRESSDGLVEEFAYDKLGRVVKGSNNHAVVEFVWNNFGDVRIEFQNGRTVIYSYDQNRNRNNRCLPIDAPGEMLWRTFDLRGRLTSIWDERHPPQHFRWDDLDRLVERRCPGNLVETFTYDNQRRLHQHRVESPDGRFVRRHTYDRAGNLAALVDEQDATFQYSYDGINRLVEVRRNGVRVEAYEYDANHAIRATHRGVRQLGPGGRVVRDGAREFTHGADGSITSIQSGSSSRRFKHDVNSRLVEVIEPDGTVITYEYDAFGRRMAKVVDGVRTEYIWELWSLAAEVRGGEVLGVYESLDHNPIAQWQGNRPFTPILDHRGAVRDVYDETGRKRWNCVLDAYGQVRSAVGDVPSPFRLRGQYHDAETGFYYNFHRHYDPESGDYTAPDPIGIEGGYNFYAYPRNPLRWDDPYGLICVNDRDGNPIPGDDPRHPDPPGGPAAGDPNKPVVKKYDKAYWASVAPIPIDDATDAARQQIATNAMNAAGIPPEQQGIHGGPPYNNTMQGADGKYSTGCGQNLPAGNERPNGTIDPNGGVEIGPGVFSNTPPKDQGVNNSWPNATPEDRALAVANHEKVEKWARETPAPGEPNNTNPPRPMGMNDSHNYALNNAANEPNLTPGAQQVLNDQADNAKRAPPEVPNPPVPNP